MRSVWEKLVEAIDDDDDLASLHARAMGKQNQSKFPGSEHVPFTTGLSSDTPQSARDDAGIPKPEPKQFRGRDTEIVRWLRATRYADIVLAIDDRKEMAELISTLAAGIGNKRPLSPQLVGRYVGKLLLAHDEEQARSVLMDLIRELTGEKK